MTFLRSAHDLDYVALTSRQAEYGLNVRQKRNSRLSCHRRSDDGVRVIELGNCPHRRVGPVRIALLQRKSTGYTVSMAYRTSGSRIRGESRDNFPLAYRNFNSPAALVLPEMTRTLVQLHGQGHR
jgi:hypothetical protein